MYMIYRSVADRIIAPPLPPAGVAAKILAGIGFRCPDACLLPHSARYNEPHTIARRPPGGDFSPPCAMLSAEVSLPSVYNALANPRIFYQDPKTLIPPVLHRGCALGMVHATDNNTLCPMR